MPVAAVDFESTYSDECSITLQGTRGYVNHPWFEAYLVSVVTSDGTTFVGHPKDFDWQSISGEEWTWVSHNASFDDPVYRRIQQLGVAPADANPREWHCTADLAAYLGAPRSLAGATNFLYDVTLDKGTRNKMKGKRWEEMSDDFRAEVIRYALADSEWCLKIWVDNEKEWPEWERRLSVHTREMSQRGIRVDVARIERGIQHLKKLSWAAEQLLPWVESGGKPLSYAKLTEECRKAGITAPASLAKDDEECVEWEEQYGTQYKWVGAMRLKRRANSLCKKLETMLRRVGPSGRADFSLKYFGAGTGRWSGEGGVNLQNFPQGEMFGVGWWAEEGKALVGDILNGPAEGAEEWGIDMRKSLIPAEGCHFNIADLSQIEPRVLWKLAGDNVSLDLVRSGMSPYEAHARATMGWTGGKLKDEDPAKYRLAKARVLALGYGAGWLKFITMARIYNVDACFDAPVSGPAIAAFEDYLRACRSKEWNLLWQAADEEMKRIYVNSWLIVSDFRETNPKIVALWKKMHAAIESSVGQDLTVTLPSGRKLVYRKVAVTEHKETGRREYTYLGNKGGRPLRTRLYGGLGVENAAQGIARDIFAVGLLRSVDADKDIVIHIHDEAVAECPLSEPASELGSLIGKAPEWWPDLPVESEYGSHAFYTK